MRPPPPIRLDLRLRQRLPLGRPLPKRTGKPLVAFYNATDGENWDESNSWLSDAPLGLVVQQH